MAQEASSFPTEFHPIAVSNEALLLPESDNRTTGKVSSTIIGAGCMDDKISLVPRSSNFSAENNSSRRHHVSDQSPSSSSSSSLKGRSKSLQNDTRHSNSGFCFHGSTILCCLRVGCRWFLLFLALSCYSILIMPGFLQVAYYYFFSKQIRRNVVYGEQPRNKLDLYMPTTINGDGPKPVVAVVTGGAWVLGYKAWGALLGRQLSESGILVACIDYRNFPRATIGDMVKDASHGISFICNNISEFGGDPNRIYLMGQSAGAHIAACALVDQVIKESGREDISWSASHIKAYFGLSGGYNLFDVIDQFDRRWMCRSFLLRIMEGEQSLERFSPQLVIQNPKFQAAASLLPRIILFHGTRDYCILSNCSTDFSNTLRGLGVDADTILYEGKAHTDLFVQDPMKAGRDKMHNDLVSIIHGDGPAQHVTQAPLRRRLVPHFMLKLATWVSPF